VELVSGQIAKGHDVAVAYLKGNGSWEEYYREQSIAVFPLGLKRYGDIKPLLLLRKAISVFRPDVVHAHLPPAELYGRLSLIGSSSSIVFIISKHLDGGGCAVRKAKRSRSWVLFWPDSWLDVQNTSLRCFRP